MTNSVFNYKIGDYELEWSTNPKDLGVTMDTGLNYKTHIANIVHTAHTRANLILKCFVTRDPAVLVKAFMAYVRPILEYCSPVWSPHLIGLIKSVEAVQRRFTKKLANLYDVPYISRLEALCLDSLEVRRIKSDLMMCFKIVHEQVCIDSSNFFIIAKLSRTRGHNYKLYKQQCCLDVRKYSFAHRVIDVWNNLPYDAVNASSLNCFKRKLDSIDFSSYTILN